MNLAVSSGHLWEIEMAPTVFGIVYVLIVSFQCLLFVFGRRFKNIFLMFFYHFVHKNDTYLRRITSFSFFLWHCIQFSYLFIKTYGY